MKFKVNSYHFNLLRDYQRLAVFKEAISDYYKYDFLKNDSISIKSKSNSSDESNLNSNEKSLCFDLGCGSGVLSYFASEYFDKVIAIEKDSSIIKCTLENLKSLNNVEVFNCDVLDFKTDLKADLLICEMLDTALIDEEEVPVLKYAKQFLKKEGKIIPQSIINVAEPIFMNNHYLQYEDSDSNPIYDILGDFVIYSEFDFLDDFSDCFSKTIEFTLFDANFFNDRKNLISNNTYNFNNESNLFNQNFNNESNLFNQNHNEKDDLINNNSFNDDFSFKINGIKLTSFTKLNENLICGPTPMLNPSILIPIEEIEVQPDSKFKIKLEYVMGGGIETIKTEILNQ